MNKLMIDGVTNIDEDLIENYFLIKEKYVKKKQARKTRNIIKWSTFAACLALVIIAIPTITNLFGYNAGISEDEIYARTHTEFHSYEELEIVIGSVTLLENFEFSSLNSYEMILKHELDNVNQFSSLSFVETMPEDSFGVAIYFPPYKDKATDYCGDENIVTINGVDVEYLDSTEGTDKAYYYIAEFECNGLEYVIRAYGNTTETVFWTKLTELLGG